MANIIDHINQSLLMQRIIKYLTLGILIYFALYHKIGSHPIELWDESLFSLRALHFFETGSILSDFNLYENLPNHRSTKLPFTTFFQVLGLKIFGVNELGIRIPTITIFVATIALMIRHFKRDFFNENFGIVFCLIALSTLGLFGPHMARTGDQDIAFSCYLLIATVYFGKYLHTSRTNALVVFTLSFIAALLTKNLLAGLIFPGVLLYTLLSKTLLSCLKDYRMYLSILSIAVAYGGTVSYLESQYPGFIDRMWNYELMGRYQKVIESHQGSPLFYLRILQDQFSPYVYLIPFIIGLSFSKNVDPLMRKLVQLMGCVFLSYIIIISFSETKTFWYLAPNYLFGIYLVTAGGLMSYNLIKDSLDREIKTSLIFGGILTFGMLYSYVLQSVLSPTRQTPKDEKYGRFISRVQKEKPQLKEFTLIDNNFATAAYFYKKKAEYSDNNLTINYQRKVEPQDGEIVMSCLGNVLDPIHLGYEYEVLYHWQDCKLLKINSKIKSNENQSEDK